MKGIKLTYENIVEGGQPGDRMAVSLPRELFRVEVGINSEGSFQMELQPFAFIDGHYYMIEGHKHIGRCKL